MRVEWTPEAQGDLARIFKRLLDYSGEDSAFRRVRRILSQAALLGTAPMMGRATRISGLRELVVASSPNVLGYRIHDDFIEIVGVRDGAEEFPAGGSWNP